MKIVIDIDDNLYTRLFDTGIDNYDDAVDIAIRKGDIVDMAKAIRKGTPLPKGHGRLIDADTYRKEMLDSREFDFFKRLDMQPTIIEADKEVENETISEN